MKLPSNVKGRDKIRNAQIIKMFLEFHEDEVHSLQPKSFIYDKLSEKFNLTQRRIEQIIRENKDFIFGDEKWEKAKRILWLKREITKRGSSEKDSADLMEQLRKEIEGEKPLIENHQHITYAWNTNEENNNSLHAPETPERNSLLNGQV